MAFPARNFQGFFQFGREVTYGVDAAATHRIAFLSRTVDVSSQLIDQDVMDGTGLLLARSLGKKTVRATFETELTYSNLGLLWDALMGTANGFGVSGVVTTGTNPYTHTFKFHDVLNSFTLEIGMGDPDNSPPTKCEQITGAKISRVTVSGAPHERLRLRVEFIGQDYSNGVTPTSLTASTTHDCVLFDALAAWDDGLGGGNNGTMVGFEMSFDNKIPDRDFASVLIAEPIRQDFPEVAMTIREEFQSKADLDAQILGSTIAQIDYQWISGSKSFKATIHSGHITEPVTREPEGKGRLILTKVVKARITGANFVTIEVINTQPLITTFT